MKIKGWVVRALTKKERKEAHVQKVWKTGLVSGTLKSCLIVKFESKAAIRR